MKRRSLVNLAVAVDIAAVCILASIILAGLGEQPALLVLLGGLATAVSLRPIRIRAIRLQLVPADAFILAALAALGPLAAILIGLMASIAAAAGGGRRKALVRLAFNAGATVLAVASAWLVFRALGGSTGVPPAQALLPLSGGAATLFAANSLLVSLPISIERRARYLATLREIFVWSLPTLLVGLALALAITAAIGMASIWTLLIAVVPCWALAFAYRLRVQRRGLPGPTSPPGA